MVLIVTVVKDRVIRMVSQKISGCRVMGKIVTMVNRTRKIMIKLNAK